MTDHERIWLEPEAESDEYGTRQWCQSNVWLGHATEYVRADLVATLRQQLEEARATLNGKPLVTDEMVAAGLNACPLNYFQQRVIRGEGAGFTRCSVSSDDARLIIEAALTKEPSNDS